MGRSDGLTDEISTPTSTPTFTLTPTSTPTSVAPQKVGIVDLDGTEFDLAKNGQFSLVRNDGPADFYGRPTAEQMSLAELTVRQIQALVNLLGESYQALQHSRDMRTASRTEGSVGTTTEHHVRSAK